MIMLETAQNLIQDRADYCCHLQVNLAASGQTITNAGNRTIFFPSTSYELYDPRNWHSGTTNTNRITVDRTGVYLAYGSIQLKDDSTNTIRILALRKNGTNFVEARCGGDSNGRWAASCIAAVSLTSGNYIDMSMHFSGASDNCVYKASLGLMLIN